MHGIAPTWSDSRRLFGPSRWLDDPGVVLEGEVAPDAAPPFTAAWEAVVRRSATALGWPEPTCVVSAHAGHLILAFTAPGNHLLTATELNEWAWRQAAIGTGLPTDPPRFAPGDLPDDATSALRQLAVLARLEAEAPTSDLAIRPGPGQCVAMVTGSNGKTTTTRLIAAMTTAAGRRTGWNCTDGVFIHGVAVESGDWSGPAGAQRVVRDDAVEAAVLETARGGILRRGLGVVGVDAVVVTNIEADHFGEYGVRSLADLAQVKLVAAKALRPGGILALNADDAELRAAALPDGPRVRWFSPSGTTASVRGTAVDAWRDGNHLFLRTSGGPYDLGDLRHMPLTAGGVATYNIANAAAAALAAEALDVPPPTIAGVLARFGADPADNAGRLGRFRLDGVELLIDYAHNPTGLTGLLAVARAIPHERLLLLLGQAGNREDDALDALAEVAWAARPDRIVLKELEGYRRGREPGEVPARLAEALRHHGAPPERLVTVLDEVAAVAAALQWARPGDLLVLPVHGLDARATVLDLLRARGAVPAF